VEKEGFMPNVQDLLREWESVWFLIGGDNALRRSFMEEAIRLGCKLPNGEKPEPEGAGPCMAMNQGLRLTYVSSMAWNASFSPNAQQMFRGRDISGVLRVDYQALIRGKAQFVYASAVGKPAVVSLAAYRAHPRHQLPGCDSPRGTRPLMNSANWLASLQFDS
jgi:hypothetical protein